MERSALAVLGIGNAIVDIISHAEDAFIVDQQMNKGSMNLIDEARAEALYRAMGPTVEASGGSAGNTIAGIASLGGKAAYIGKVRDDVLGRVFRHDMTSLGVVFRTTPSLQGPATARCLIFVSTDAQRTMNTYLGACTGLGPEDIDPNLVRDAAITYLEGYLYDPPLAKQAFHDAAEIAHGAGRKVSLSLSDSFCVDRHRDGFLDLVKHHVDILFANEAEITALFQCDFDEAVDQARTSCELAAVTRGSAGSLIISREETIEVAAASVPRVVDTTGAGDLYASGFLYGLTSGRSLAECGQLASLSAAEVISHFGARPETPLAQYVAASQS